MFISDRNQDYGLLVFINQKAELMYRIEPSKHGIWIVLNQKGEVVYFGTLENCLKFREIACNTVSI